MSSHYVYVIVNKINLKLYFGSHSWEGTGLDPNYYGSGKIIKQAVKKYGKDNFIVYPIKFYDNVDECRRAEEELLTKYDISNNQYCYNIKNGAIGWTSEDITGKNNPMYGRTGEKNPNYGKTVSEQTRNRISQSQGGKPFVAIKDGKVKIFISQHECSRVLGLHIGNIHRCLKGRRNHTGGYIIKYLKRCSTDYKITKRKAKETEKIKLTIKIKGTTPVVAIQKDTGRVRMFKSQRECSRVLGIHNGNINACLKGRLKSTGGYTFKKINRDKRVFTVSQRSKADLNVLRGIAE